VYTAHDGDGETIGVSERTLPKRNDDPTGTATDTPDTTASPDGDGEAAPSDDLAAGVSMLAAPNVDNEVAGVSVQTSHTPPITRSKPSEAPAPTASSAPSETIAPTAPTADSTDSIDTRITADPDPTRRTPKQRRGDLDEYRRRFMQTPRIEDRKPVFVSRATRDRLDRIVRLLGERGMSVSGLIENIALHHIDTHEPDVEYWRRM
jgi:hypothetical protein